MARRNQFMKQGETTFRQLLEANWKIPNEKILKHFELTADENGYPYIANWPDFIKEKDELEVFKTLMYYLLKKKLPLPLVTISTDDIKELFWKYKNKNISPFVHDCDLNSPLIHRLSNDPYYYDYDKHSLGYFPQNISANKISNYFAQKERMLCEVTNRESPTFLWTTEHGMSRLMDCLKRVHVTTLSEYGLKKVFGYAGQVAAQFNVNTSKNIYNLLEGKSVFDISCGWGDRLTGFYLSNKEIYIGTDPNENMFEIYKEMCQMYEKWLGNKNLKIIEKKHYFEFKGVKTVKIYNLPAEDLPYNDIPNVDVTFSSPPYFNKELYGKDSKKENNQSWKRYNSDDEWLNSFLYVVLDNMIPKSKSTLVNITDIGTDVRENRKRICDPMVDRYKKDFKGIAGFQLSKNMNLVKNLDGIYTEPIWVFGDFPVKQKIDLMQLFA